MNASTVFGAGVDYSFGNASPEQKKSLARMAGYVFPDIDHPCNSTPENVLTQNAVMSGVVCSACGANEFRFTSDPGSALLYYGDEYVAKFSVKHRQALESALSERHQLLAERDALKAQLQAVQGQHETAMEHAVAGINECEEMRKERDQLQEQLAKLHEWKESQLALERTWNEQAVGRELGVTPGKSIRANILPAIQKLRADLAAAQQDSQLLEAIVERGWVVDNGWDPHEYRVLRMAPGAPRVIARDPDFREAIRSAIAKTTRPTDGTDPRDRMPQQGRRFA